MSEPILVIEGITDASTLACIARSRTYPQYCDMVDQALKGECHFCSLGPQNVLVVHDLDWKAWQNPYPEKHTKHHFIIAPLRHIKSTSDLSITEQVGLFTAMEKLRKKHEYTSRGMLIRDGDATLSAGTIQHLHVHVMVPDGTGRVESPFYKGADEEKAGIRRAIAFEKLRQGAQLKELLSEERILVSERL